MNAKTDYGVRNTKKRISQNFASDNGNCSTFVIIKDATPERLYTEGVSTMRAIDMWYMLRDGVFPDGMVFSVNGERLRVDRGILVYAKNRAKYILPSTSLNNYKR